MYHNLNLRIMKRFFKKMGSFVFLFSTLLLCTACPDPDPDENKVLSIDKSDLKAFKSDGETQYVDVLAENVSWSVEVEEDGSWLNAKKDGSRIKLTAEKNTTESDRSTTVKVNCETDNNLSKEFIVKQEGLKIELSVSGLDAPFDWQKGSNGNAQVLSITCSTSWTIEGKPEWLDITPLSGTGNSTVRVWPNCANNSSNELKATLIVKSGTKTATKEVIQRAGLSIAKTTPTNVLVMSFGIACDFSCNSEVAYYDWAIMQNSEITKYSDDELAKVIKTASISDRKTPEDQWVVSTTKLKSTETKGVDYTILTVSYDKNGERGEVVKYPFTTKPTSNIPQAWASNLNLVEYNDNYYLIWDMEGNTYVNKYYTWAVLAKNSFLTYTISDYLVAWLIFKEINKNANSHDTDINSSRGYSTSYEHLEGPQIKLGEQVGIAPFGIETKYVQIVSWATDQDNNLSGDLDNTTIDLTRSSSPRRMGALQVSQKKNQNKNQGFYQGMNKKVLESNLSILPIR